MTYTWSSYLQVYNKKQFSFSQFNYKKKYSHFKVLTEKKYFHHSHFKSNSVLIY